jgi:outer membrane protein OmpA-like peptidoglycan-associated protein
MALTSYHAEPERLQKRWILGALGIALLVHVGAAGLFGFYKIPRLETPATHLPSTGPFNVKRIEIDAKTLDSPQPDPVAHLPAAEPPPSPSQFNLDTSAIDKALQTPQPALNAPAVPEPSRVIAAADLSSGAPFAVADSAQVSAEIAQVRPTELTGNPTTGAKLAQDLISSTAGLPQPGGKPAGAPESGTGTTGQLPGFAALAPGFQASAPNLSKLPEPVLLRLPSDVLFDFDSAQLKPEANSLLTQAETMIAKYPQASVTVDGYSDSFGRPDYNQTLSQQRAEAVQAWLRDHAGAGQYKFQAQGHGSADFIVPTTGTIDQQQPNRRVEIVIQALQPE